MLSNYEPHTWLGILGLAILAVGGIVAAWITAHGARKSAKGLKGDVAEVRDQVKNGHSSNLRDDLDDVKHIVLSIRDRLEEQRRDISGLREDLGGLRGEIRDERTDRIELDRRLSRDLSKREHEDP